VNSTRLTLLTFIALAAVALLFGGVGGSILLHEVAESNYRLQVVNNREYGQRFAAALESQLWSGMPEEEVLRVLQESFDAAPSDESRYVCVLSTKGDVLCHPSTSLVGVNAAENLVMTRRDHRKLPFSEWLSGRETEAFKLAADGVTREELIQRIPMTSAPWQIVVHTNLNAIAGESVALSRTILAVTVPTAALFVLMATIVVRVVSRRQEKEIERANHELEKRVQKRTAELSQTVAELQRTRDALVLREKMSLLGQLIAGIAHEINNPIQAISLFAESLREEAQDEDQRRAAERIARSAQRCGLLVKNLLSFARNEPPHRSPVSVSALVTTALHFSAADLEEANVEVQRVHQGGDATLFVDRIQIEQVILNLVTNAMHALAQRPAPRTIRISTLIENDELRLMIEDNGPGLPQDIQAHLFEPFHTTKAEGKGTGLGLSLCRQFVSHHGGEIVYTRGTLGGACFTIRLPQVSLPHLHATTGSHEVLIG
jgi:C4-dicarboxylate-specific signal transduction histidine kinase